MRSESEGSSESRYEKAIRGFSLKFRLAATFALFALMSLAFASFLMIEYHSIAIGGAEIARRSHDEISRVLQMQDSLGEIERLAAAGEVNSIEISHFRRLVAQVRLLSEDTETGRSADDIESKFDQFVDAIASPGTARKSSGIKQAYYDDVVAAVGALTERNQSSIYELADTLRQKQAHALQIGLVSTAFFLIILGFTGYRLISYITSPLMTMARFIEGVDVESGAAVSVPLFGSAPEIALVARSFERLLERLRVYRALNLRRLLSEKRRADIIAASISDGIVLLKGHEVLYANPVAELILKAQFSGAQAGAASRGMRALLSAVTRTIPVEFSMEMEDGTRHFLIQSFPISHELIDKMGGEQIMNMAGEFQATTIVVAQDVTIVKESQEAKGHFLATLSHEVKTPVTSLTLATRMLLRSVDQFPNPTQRSLIRTCTEDVDRLRVLLDELMTVSRFDSLTQKIQLQETDFAKLMKHAVQSFREQAREKEIDLSIEVRNEEHRSAMLSIDPPKVAWAISNLLINALRHSPRGSKVVALVEVKPEWIEVRIRDSGPGIDKRRLERIFDKFSSFYDIRVARSGSAGVGLSIAREIVQAHGGRIWAVSEVGDGAEFGFALPFKRSDTELSSKGALSGASSRS